MQFNIDIIDVERSEITRKDGKGTYDQLTVTYKKDDGKVDAKKLMGFGNGKTVFERLSTAGKGERFSITAEKNDKGYWDWTDIGKQTEKAPEPQSKMSTVPNRGFETTEERQARQVYIIKQSSIASAVELLKDKEVSPEDVIKAAEVFVSYVLGTRVQDMTDDVPF